jgi:hypothetical protein
MVLLKAAVGQCLTHVNIHNVQGPHFCPLHDNCTERETARMDVCLQTSELPNHRFQNQENVGDI